MSTRRVTLQQLECLWEFLNSHRDVALGYNKSAQARETAKRMWERVSQNLNATGEGAFKNWKEWAKYWVDYKAKLKKKVAVLRISQQRTGGGPSQAVPLTAIEEKFLQIVGPNFGSGLPGVRVEPFPEEQQHLESPDVFQSLSEPRQQQMDSNESNYIVVVTPDESQQNVQAVDARHDSPPPCPSSAGLTDAANTFAGPSPSGGRVAADSAVGPSNSGGLTIAADTPAASSNNGTLVVAANEQPPEGEVSPHVERSPRASANTSRSTNNTRRRRREKLTAEDARRQLINTSHLRGETERQNSETMVRLCTTLEGISAILERLDSNRLNQINNTLIDISSVLKKLDDKFK